MSSMLEQAIVDAQALREAALKNAEQALIEKFAPQIKDAVESLLENEVAERKQKVSYMGENYSLLEINDTKATIAKEGKKPFIVETSELSEEILTEAEEEEQQTEETMLDVFEDLPYAVQTDENNEVVYEFSMEQFDQGVTLDLGDVMGSGGQESYDSLATDMPATEPQAAAPEADAGEGDLLAGLGLQESLEESDEDLVNEILNLMNEIEDDEELLEEELIVDMDHVKDGTHQTQKEILEYYEEMRKAKEYAESKKEENEGLKETLKKFKMKNKQYKDAVEKLSNKLNETLLSNAKLIYSNKTLGDASLNERQKSKIVEAIAKARTPEEAKNLHEALNATVTSGNDKKSPRTLSESVQRKSNLSGILPRRKQVNENETHTFADHMKKLAGIK